MCTHQNPPQEHSAPTTVTCGSTRITHVQPCPGATQPKAQPKAQHHTMFGVMNGAFAARNVAMVSHSCATGEAQMTLRFSDWYL